MAIAFETLGRPFEAGVLSLESSLTRFPVPDREIFGTSLESDSLSTTDFGFTVLVRWFTLDEVTRLVLGFSDGSPRSTKLFSSFCFEDRELESEWFGSIRVGLANRAGVDDSTMLLSIAVLREVEFDSIAISGILLFELPATTGFEFVDFV